MCVRLLLLGARARARPSVAVRTCGRARTPARALQSPPMEAAEALPPRARASPRPPSPGHVPADASFPTAASPAAASAAASSPAAVPTASCESPAAAAALPPPPPVRPSGGFWDRAVAAARAESRPLLLLAPMHEITDCAFRELVCTHARPDAVFTEFVSVDGLVSPGGRDSLLRMLQFTRAQRPVVAQFFGTDPLKFRECARLARELGFDGVDVNMGCAVPKVCKQGAGAALISKPALAQEIVRETMRGAEGLPVSVKTRIGFTSNVLSAWLPALLATRPAAITIHFRTQREQSAVPAHWELARTAVELARGTGVYIVGNGDVWSAADAVRRQAESGVDGVMIARGAIGNPWIFDVGRATPVSIEERIEAMLAHVRFYERFGHRRWAILARHLGKYARGLPGTRECNKAFADVTSPSTAEDLLAIVRRCGEILAHHEHDEG